MSGPEEIEATIEAILYASTEPVSRKRLEQVFESADAEVVGAALERVVERYADDESRGVFLEEVAGGLRLATRPELHGNLRAYFDISGQNRLSMAALETLAIVAYRQPVTGPEIQDLRGVNSSGVLKTLLDRRLIRIAGRKQVVGKPFIYRTTREFLMHFGLAVLSDLPPLEEFEESFGALEAEGVLGDEGLIDDEAGSDGPDESPSETAATDEPATDEPAADEQPAIGEPGAEEQATKGSLSQEPFSQEPTPQEPVSEELTSDGRADEESAAEESGHGLALVDSGDRPDDPGEGSETAPSDEPVESDLRGGEPAPSA